MKKEKESSTRNPNEKNDIMILAIAKSVHYSSKHFSNAAMLDERKRERANLETMLARVAGRYVGVWTTKRDREGERSFLVTSRETIRLPAYVRLYIYISLSLSLGRLVFNPRRTPLMNLEKITDGG